jgi:hypothetical protein
MSATACSGDAMTLSMPKFLLRKRLARIGQASAPSMKPLQHEPGGT